MKRAESIFNIIVIAVVMLTGGIFGAYIGSAYQGFVYNHFDESFVWAGMTAGLVGAYPLAKLYLRKMSKAITEEGSKKEVWSIGTFLAGLYGIICTVFTHGVMMVFSYFRGGGDLLLGLITLTVGLFVGAVTGIIVGAICSLVYVLSIKGN
ncbi:MAG: hypothetical protein OEV87_12015 [Phycisphaerae bacterium]|nr:hypothetical protein [Phycisphaerae bacterium]